MWQKDSLRKLCWKLDGKKDRIGNVFFVHRKQGLFLSENANYIKMATQKHNMAPMWKKLMKNVDLDEHTSFLDHVYLGCTQRECKPNEIDTEEYTSTGNLRSRFFWRVLCSYSFWHRSNFFKQLHGCSF